MSPLRRAQLLVGLLVAVVVGIGAPMRATYGARTTADEPHYLLTAISLAEDHDLDVSDERAAITDVRMAVAPWSTEPAVRRLG